MSDEGLLLLGMIFLSFLAAATTRSREWRILFLAIGACFSVVLAYGFYVVWILSRSRL